MSVGIGDNEYVCECCGGVFEKGWGNDEAVDESIAMWGHLPSEELAIVCDDCYEELMASLYLKN